MRVSKGAYLKKITAALSIKSASVGKEMAGSTPPSVFVGSYNYPKVLAGPMVAPEYGNTEIMDSPEKWIPGNKSQEEIIGYRLNLVRGKMEVDAKDTGSKYVSKLQEIALAESSIDSEVKFRSQPRGAEFSDEHTPHGPSALVEEFEVGNCRWTHQLEKAYYDTDLRAEEAIVNLYKGGVPFSKIEKAFSVGTMGLGKNRKLVPTRWSITACDSALADNLLEEVKHHEVIDRFQVYGFSSLNNRYSVILMPTAWQYEWIEAFMHVLGRDEMVFSDYETNRGKKEYSSVGGCYYSCKFGVLEGLARMRKQAGAIVLREAGSGYIPLGVFNVRENVRNAMARKPREFETLKEALAGACSGFELPASRFVEEGTLLRDALKGRQTSLAGY